MAAREYGIEIGAIDATLVSIEKVLDLPGMTQRVRRRLRVVCLARSR